jgi:signal transduction histidine kinase
VAILASLTNRIFLAAAALAVVSIATAVYFVSRTATAAAEAELQRGLIEAGALVDQQCATLVETFTVMARLVADSPRLKAAVDTVDPPTVQPVADEYRGMLHAASLVLTGRNGKLLAEAGDVNVSETTVAALPEIRQSLAGRESSGFWPHADGMLHVITVPITIGLESPEIMGVLAIGFRLDNELAAQFKRATESDIAFAVDGRVRASTLSADDRDRLTQLLRGGGVQTIALGDGEYVALRRPLVNSAAPVSATSPSVLLLRSRTERLRFLNSIHTGLGIVGMLAVLAATILSYAVARTITRPLATITGVMREMSATGDLTRKISVGPTSSWDDEDAKLLASTFNTLTDSIARFQREGAQRERLSSLGRLSTVIAHEIRNPLMIIKGSLRTLGNQNASRAETAQALADVDEEVARLNRIVNDVLDFARPIRFEYASADVNALCRDAAQSTRQGHEWMEVQIRLDPALRPMVTDADRLRTALVNILANARQAVAARAAQSTPTAPDIQLSTDAGMPGWVRIAIRDHGVGVKPEDAARVFDPYFTTKRTGSGLGLAIAKNIVEGLGGSLALESEPGVGTEIRIDIPSREAHA